MRLMPILLIATCIQQVLADDNCLKTQTSCIADDGTNCRWIKQIPRRNNSSGQGERCGRKRITISSQWCNYTGEPRTIVGNRGAVLALTGPAITSINNGKPLTFSAGESGLGGSRVLMDGRCDEASWDAIVDTCQSHFNYEVNIHATSSVYEYEKTECRGYNFARQMKSLCNLNASIECTVLDGSGKDGTGTPCDEIQPCIRIGDNFGSGTSIECNCDSKDRECIQDVRYDFSYSNANSRTLRLATESSMELESMPASKNKLSKTKIGWRVTDDNGKYFRDSIPKWGTKNFSVVEHNVNVCDSIPQASIFLAGRIIDRDSETDEADENYGVCQEYLLRRPRKSPQLPYCEDLFRDQK